MADEQKPDAGAGKSDDGSNQGGAPAWVAQLPADLKVHKDLTGFQTIGDLGKAFLDVKGKAEGAVRIPGEKATPEERQAFYRALGAPENPDGYDLPRPEVPQGWKYNEEQERKFRELSHGLGLTAAQAKALHEFHSTEALAQGKAAEKIAAEMKDQAVKELKGAWGGEYDRNLELARRGLKEFAGAAGGDEAIRFIEASGFGDSPVVIRMFHLVGKLIQEDGLVHGKLPGRGKREPERTPSGRLPLSFPSMEKKKQEEAGAQ